LDVRVIRVAAPRGRTAKIDVVEQNAHPRTRMSAESRLGIG